MGDISDKLARYIIIFLGKKIIFLKNKALFLLLRHVTFALIFFCFIKSFLKTSKLSTWKNNLVWNGEIFLGENTIRPKIDSSFFFWVIIIKRITDVHWAIKTHFRSSSKVLKARYYVSKNWIWILKITCSLLLILAQDFVIFCSDPY